MYMLQKPVPRCAREQRITEQWVPLLHRPVGGHDQRATLVPTPDHVVQVERFFATQRPKPEVVDDEQLGVEVTNKSSVPATVGTGCSEGA